MGKPRILHVGEASWLSSGYGVYSREVNTRLHASGKYEVAELACYDDGTSDAGRKVPWKVFPNVPTDPVEFRAYQADPSLQFGGQSFEQACLAFRPDIVWDVRDQWMVTYAENSPFRRHFHLALMPTVDAIPQQEHWIGTFMGADSVLCYTEWGVEQLRRQGGGLIPLRGTASPAADYETFRPLDRAAVRRGLGVPADALVVGTTMRNQPRKLIPELIDAFGRFLRVAAPSVARRSILYLHTSYPDLGWDVPSLVKNSGFAGRILLTYACKACGGAVASPFRGPRVPCPDCGEDASLTSTRGGATRRALASVMNSFDAYVQYANSEGFGMPQVEAAACGVPVFAVDYSAMGEVARRLRGHAIPPLHLSLEQSTGCFRAVPDNAALAAALCRFFDAPSDVRGKAGRRARDAAVLHYSWDRAAASWMGVFDSAPPAVPWDAPSRAHEPVDPPEIASDDEFVRWCLANHLGRPEMAGTYAALRMTRDILWGRKMGGSTLAVDNEYSLVAGISTHADYGRPEFLAELRQLNARFNKWERARCGK